MAAATSVSDEALGPRVPADDPYRSLLLAQQALLGPVPDVEVSFSDLTYHVVVASHGKGSNDADASADGSKTSSSADSAPRPHIPTVFNVLGAPLISLAKLVIGNTASSDEGREKTGKSATTRLKVLDRASGTLKAGRMALILAPPGSSKSSLLKALSDRLTGAKKATAEEQAARAAETASDDDAIKPGRLYGSIRYSGLSQDEAAALPEPVNVPSLVTYVSQADEHFPALNVRETLEFAAHNKRCPLTLEGEGNGEQRVGSVNAQAFELLSNPSRAVDHMLKQMKLEEAEHTALGNEQIKGCSGGQRKRVTVAEGLIGHHRVALLDEVSNGLDASTTLELMKGLRTWVEVTNGSVCAALLQPTPEILECFDDIILMKEGAIVYFGPREAVASYFASLGFAPPSAAAGSSPSSSASTAVESSSHQHPHHHHPHQQHHSNNSDLADWLIELLSNPQALWEKQQAQSKGRGGAQVPPPLTTDALSAAWKQRCGPDGLLPQAASAAPPQPALQGLPLTTAWSKRQYGSAYPVPLTTQLGQLLKRQAKLSLRDFPFMFAKLIGALVMALVLGSLFSDSQLNFTLLMGAALFSLIHLAFGGGIEIAVLMEQRFTVYKQLGARMYAPWLSPLAYVICLMPLSIVEVLVFSSVAYFITGFSRTAGQYFFFALMLLLVALAEGAYFRLIGYLASSPQAANTFTGPIVSLQVIFAGYLITYQAIPAWFVWIYWGLSPLSWALRAIANSELQDPGYDTLLPDGQTLRQYYLSTFQFQGGNQWLWAAVVFIIGFWLILLGLSMWALTKVRFDRSLGSSRPQLQQQQQQQSSDAVVSSAAAVVVENPAKAVVPSITPPAPISTSPPGITPGAAPAPDHHNGAGVAVDMGVAVPADMASGVGQEQQATSSRVDGGGALDSMVSSSGASTPVGSLSSPSSPIKASQADDLSEQEGAGAAASAATEVAVAVVHPHSPAAVVPEPAPVVPAPASASSSSASSVRHALPYTPVTLAFSNIVYDVPLPKKAGGGIRRLLRGVSGYVKPGQLLLLMGSSGSGKSTLLDSIANRKTSGTLAGDVFLDGRKVDKRVFARQTAYVEQFDTHLPHTTVREALQFSAELRLPSTVTYAQREAFIDEILDILELSALQHRLVGKPNSDGLSPSEMKRLSIGVELCGNAPICFADEPTTGLASREAEIVMRVLRRVADSGRAVVCTVHQPSFQIYSMADSLLLLQKGGYQVFSGPLGAGGRNIVSYLREAAEAVDGKSDDPSSALPYFVPFPPEGQNPASYMLEALGEEAGWLQAESDATASPTSSAFKAPVGGWYAAYWLRCPHHQQFQQELQAVIAAGTSAQPASSAVASVSSDYARSFPAQLWVLLRRSWKAYNRNVESSLTKLLVLAALGLLFGGIYYNLGPEKSVLNSFASVQNTIACLFLTLSFSGIIVFNVGLPLFESERALVFRETSSRTYTSFAYSLAMFLVEIPWLSGIVLVFCCCFYFLVGFVTSQGAGTFFHFALVLLESGLLFSALSQLFAFAFPTVQTAQATGGIIVSLYFLLAGLFAPKPQIPKGWAWFVDVNPLSYGLNAVVSPQLYCYEANVALCPALTVPTGTVPTGLYVSGYFGLDYSKRWSDVGYLFIFIVAFAVASALALRYIQWIKR